MTELAAILESYRDDAKVLRRAGHDSEATLVERLCKEVEQAAGPWLTWLSETQAMLRSNRSRAWLRSRFADWERDGNARVRLRDRQYREAIIPQHHAVIDAATAGTEAAKKMRQSA